jgi:hypothetical protein
MKVVLYLLSTSIFVCAQLLGMGETTKKVIQMLEYNDIVVKAEEESRNTRVRTEKYDELMMQIKHAKEKRDALDEEVWSAYKSKS